MNTKLLICLTSIWVFCSCDKSSGKIEDGEYPFYTYTLYLNILDASGNDRIKGIEIVDTTNNFAFYDAEHSLVPIKHDLYTLDIVFPEGSTNLYIVEPLSGGQPMNHPELFLYNRNGYNYIGIDVASYKFTWPDLEEIIPPVGKFVFQVTCPYIFGDEAVHEIVTWWELDPNFSKNYENELTPIYCHSIEFENKEITNLANVDDSPFWRYASIASLTLDSTFDDR